MPNCAPPARCWPRASRVNERTRISRELHDLLGHHLTALSLNLEVAGHLSEGRVQEHVQQAHTLAELLLTDVREAVSQLREGGAIDLAAALRPLAENVPRWTIHMDIEDPLTLDDPERAHVLLRCTQEIITNAVRHAGARNLWIDAAPRRRRHRHRGARRRRAAPKRSSPATACAACASAWPSTAATCRSNHRAGRGLPPAPRAAGLGGTLSACEGAIA